MSLYDILGVKADADDKEIRHAYRKKAQKLHPDRPTGDTEEFQRLVDAYNVLIDEERRRRYDETGDTDKTDTESVALRELVKVLLSLVSEVESVTTTNIIEECARVVRRGQEKGRHTATGLESDRADYLEVAGRISCTEGPNILAEAMRNTARQIGESIAMLQAQVAIGDDILKQLSHYSYRTDLSPHGTRHNRFDILFAGLANTNTRYGFASDGRFTKGGITRGGDDADEGL